MEGAVAVMKQEAKVGPGSVESGRASKSPTVSLKQEQRSACFKKCSLLSSMCVTGVAVMSGGGGGVGGSIGLPSTGVAIPGIDSMDVASSSLIPGIGPSQPVAADHTTSFSTDPIHPLSSQKGD